jgi:2-polyprenyl-6-methoxyphenol hydroxylase-like FAD-dependent oxidoreductase
MAAGTMTAVVAGGGIAGLASAVSLAQNVYYLCDPLPAYVSGRVIFVGDAAHAALAAAGQGAATALEDGVCVGRRLERLY